MKKLYWGMGSLLVIIILSSIVWGWSNRFAGSTDAGIIRYEEFQEIYNACDKLNTDLCNMKGVPDTDKMFEQFSKIQRILELKTKLNKWVQDYNAKSKMWNRALWKSKSLPYQLTVEQYPCY
jgi:hypothetical protein